VRFFEIIDRVLSYHQQADISLLEKAYVFSAQMHRYQTQLTGQAYLGHCLAVAGILAQMRLDDESITSGLLHGSLRGERITLSDLEENFGANIARIVHGVTKLSQLEYSKHGQTQAEYLRKMILATSQDVRVVLVKLADRMHEMRSLRWQSSEEQKSLLQETLDIYAPLAARLGIDWMKQGLEDLAFKYLYPEAYEEIAQGLAKTREEIRRYTEKVRQVLTEKMEEHGLKGRVLGRPKHLYSIYKKMIRQNLDIQRIYDLIAFRIILDSESVKEEDRYKECYEALAMVQALWEPVPGRFKDYITKPKPNGYQSLHTTVIGPYGERVEIQIRTEEMDVIANEGIAAHWIYKENKSSQKVDTKETQHFSWVRHLLEWEKNSYDPKEFFEGVKVNLYPEEVYVFTPQREVKVFPREATPVDFAYQIHTEVGHRCVGARVNGKIVPLHYQLQNGDVVEILTAKRHRPSKDWLKIVKTSKARDRIRRWIKMEEWERSVAMGKEMCEREFRKKGLNFNHYLHSTELEEVAQAFSLRSVEDLLVTVGYGKISPGNVLGKLSLSFEEEQPEREEFPFEKRKPSKTDEGIRVTGVDDVMSHMANCCHPLPGEPIVGYITRGRGITVHRVSCKNLLKADKDRLIEVQWDTGDSQSYPVDIRVTYFGGKGMLGTLNSVLSQLDTNVINVHMDSRANGLDVCQLRVEVKDTEHLQRVLAALRREKNVRAVQRSAE
jgi:GTP pyrophosphokinase